MPNARKNQAKDASPDYFRIQAINADTAHIDLYGYVGDWDADALYFREKLNEIGDVSNIDLNIHSDGGSVYEGIAIFNLLKNHPAQITVYINGVACSMASYIAMVGDMVVMPENAMMMIHNPRGGVYGEEKDVLKFNEQLSAAKRAMVGAYVAKSGQSEEEIIRMMDEETWMTGTEAVALGFADVLEKPVDMAACMDIDLSKYPKAGAFLEKNFSKLSASAGNTTKGITMPKTTTAATDVQAETDNQPAAQNESQAVSQAVSQALTAEKNRQNDIRAVFANIDGDYHELMDACLDDQKVTMQDAQGRLLEAIGKQTKPTRYVTVTDEVDNVKAGMTAAIMARAGLETDNTQNNFRGFTLLEMARKSLEIKGISTKGMDKMAVVALAFTHTASDFTYLFQDVANKSMLKGYEEAAETFELFTTVVSMPDFKQVSRVDTGAFPSLRQVRDGAEYKSVTMDDTGAVMQLATYGEKFGITRHAIINDDIDAFSRIPKKMGFSAKRTVGDLVYSVLTDNPKMSDNVALFHATHKNLGTGALNETNLLQLKNLMRLQKSGKANLNIRPEFLLVPVALEAQALKLMNSEVALGASNNEPNAVQGLASVISEPRLDDASATEYYLMAGSMYDTIEVGYLDGNPNPVIEQQSGWDIDGVEFKVRLDATAGATSYRGMAKSTGQ